MQIKPITKNQGDRISKNPDFKLDRENKPFRILTGGQAVNISTGELSRKNSNILYHPLYWDISKEGARMIKTQLEKNNPDKAFKIVFSG